MTFALNIVRPNASQWAIQINGGPRYVLGGGDIQRDVLTYAAKQQARDMGLLKKDQDFTSVGIESKNLNLMIESGIAYTQAELAAKKEQDAKDAEAANAAKIEEVAGKLKDSSGKDVVVPEGKLGDPPGVIVPPNPATPS